MVMLGEGVMLTPDLAGCVSTPMTKQHVDTLIAAADTAFNVLENRA
jgi:glutamate-1-semialdehyde aminotransferase